MDFDLTIPISRHLDKHLVLQLLEYIEYRVNPNIKFHTNNDEKNTDIELSDHQKKQLTIISLEKYKLLSQTYMFDYATKTINDIKLLDDTYKIDPFITDTNNKKQALLDKLKDLDSKVGSFIDFLSNKSLVLKLLDDKTFTPSFLLDKYKFDANAIDLLFEYCKIRINCGQYKHTNILLRYYRLLTVDVKKEYQALWAKLLCEILLNEWEDAHRSLKLLRKVLDDQTRSQQFGQLNAAKSEEKDDEKGVELEENPVQLSSSKLMKEKAWFLHWSLFIYYNREGNLMSELIDLCFDINYMNCIQTLCPHLLRYLTFGIIIAENIELNLKMKYLYDVSRYILEEEYTYNDPILNFVKLLIRKNNFTLASKYLNESINVISNDFFLSYFSKQYFEYARCIFLKKYSYLYSVIDVNNIAKLLHLNDKDTDYIQTWIVDAIRGQNRDIKLDVVNNILYIKFNESNPYQLMRERTRMMNDRIIHVLAELDKLA